MVEEQDEYLRNKQLEEEHHYRRQLKSKAIPTTLSEIIEKQKELKKLEDVDAEPPVRTAEERVKKKKRKHTLR